MEKKVINFNKKEENKKKGLSFDNVAVAAVSLRIAYDIVSTWELASKKLIYKLIWPFVKMGFALSITKGSLCLYVIGKNLVLSLVDVAKIIAKTKGDLNELREICVQLAEELQGK